MTAAVTFLTESETKDFKAVGRRLRRHVVERHPGVKEGDLDLNAEISEVIRRRTTGEGLSGPWFEAFCIEIAEGDGMTWSAELTRRALHERFPHFDHVTIMNERGAEDLPCIASVVGVDRFLHAAAKLRIVPLYFSFRSWQSMLIFVSVVVLTCLTQLITALIDQHATTHSFLSPSLVGIGLGYGVVAVFGQWLLAARFRTRDQSAAVLIEKLQSDERLSNEEELVERLAALLADHPQPRFVIVDGFDSLDSISRRVIEEYFSRASVRGRAADCWVIFEALGSGGLAPQIELRGGEPGFSRMRLYSQKALSEDERKHLAAIVTYQDRAVFAAVKQICRFRGGDVEWIETFFRDYVRLHGAERKSALSYFYLLAMETPDLSPQRRDAPLGGEAFFSVRWADDLGEAQQSTAKKGDVIPARSWTAEKVDGHRRSRLLAQFFGEPLRTGDIDRFGAEISRDFRRFLRQGSTLARMQVSREVALWLHDHAEELKLPSPGLAKLYWALTLWEKKGADAFWLRRAAHHLLEADFSELSEDVRAQILESVRAMYFGLVEAHIVRCRFGDVVDLLEAGATFLVDYDPQKDSQLRRLLPIAWRIYHVTGSDRVLNVILTIYGELAITFDGAATAATLEQLFTETCQLKDGSRSLLRDRFAAATDADLASARDYGVVTAAWLAATGAPFLYFVSSAPGTHGVCEIADFDVVLTELIDRVTNRIATSPDHVQVLDIAAISTAVWTLVTLQNEQISCVTTEKNAEGHFFSTQAHVNRIEQTLIGAEKIVIAAAAYVRATGKPKSMVDYLGLAMVNDACATALAATWAMYATGKLSMLPETERLDRVTRVVEDVEQALGMTILGDVSAAAVDPDAVAMRIEALLHACAMTWQRFGLTRLGTFISVRRVHFCFLARRIAAHDYAAHKPLLESISAILRDRDCSGVIANLAVAQCVAESAELAAYYLGEAAQLASDADFGSGLRSTLRLTAALHSVPREKERTTRCLAALFEPGEDGETEIGAYLKSLPPSDVMMAMLRLYRAVRIAEVREHSCSLQTLIGEHAATIDNESVSAELRGLLDVVRIEDAIAEGKAIDPDEIMKQWASRRDSWAYPSVLTRLLASGSDARTRSEAVSILDRDPDKDAYSTWYHLALQYATTADSERSADLAGPLSYVERTVARWENQVQAETNLTAYSLLARLHVSKRAEFRQRLIDWQSIIMQRDHLQLLPYLAKVGKFFLIFDSYVRHMTHWGLELTVSPADYHRRRNLPPLVRVRAASDWRRNGSVIPKPLVEQDHTIKVDGEFLLIGSLFFSAPLESEVAYDGERLAFNREARQALPMLIDQVRRLLDLPAAVRDLIENYSHQSLLHP